MILILLGFVISIIDSSLGMLYGTILSPLLLLFFDPKIVIPAILLSQGLGGISAIILHNKYINADFSFNKNSDIKYAMQIIIPGLIAILLGTIIVIKLNPNIIKIYTAVLIMLIGLMIVNNKKIVFSKGSIFIIGFISAFNKVISGGGFGPIVTGGQIAVGVPTKKAIAIEAFSKAPICLTGFIVYYIFNGILDYKIGIFLSIGSVFGSMLGPKIISIPKTKFISKIIGYTIFLLGLLLLISLLGLFIINI